MQLCLILLIWRSVTRMLSGSNIHKDLLLGTSETKLARATWRGRCSFKDDQQIVGCVYHSTTHFNSNRQLGFMIQQPTLPSSHSNAWIAQFHIMSRLQSPLITWYSRRRSGKFLRPTKSLAKTKLFSYLSMPPCFPLPSFHSLSSSLPKFPS
jgi:hypothetical protein